MLASELRRGRRARALSILLTLSAFSVAIAPSASVAAAPAPSTKASGPTQKELDAARKAFGDGIDLEAKEQWSQAREKFEEVAKVRMTPAVRFHIALCEEHEGKLIEALHDFELAEADAKTEKVAGVAKEAPEHAAAVRARIPKLTLKLPKSATGVTATLDDQPFDATSADGISVNPGEHKLAVKADERTPFALDFTLIEGDSKTIHVKRPKIEKKAAEPEPEPTPVEPVPVEPPAHSMTATYIVGGAGIAALAGAGIFAYLRSSEISDLDKTCQGLTCPSTASSTISSGKSYTLYANIFGLLGVVGVGAGIYLYVSAPKPSAPGTPPAAPDTSIRLVPQADGANVAGLSILGAF